MSDKKDKNRDEISGKLTEGLLGSQYNPDQSVPSYMLPPLPPGGELPQQLGSGLQLGGLSLEGYGQGGSIDRARRLDPYGEYGIRGRYTLGRF